MPLQGSGQMSFADVYNEMTGEQLTNPPISITAAELGQLQNANGQTIPLNTNYTPRPNGNLPTVFPDEWYLYCQSCNTASPYITISKSAPSSATINTEFAYRIVIANNGQVNSAGDIVVSDTIPAGLTYVRFERDTPAWGVSVSGQNVTAIFSSTLPVGLGAVITIYVRTDIQATYTNYATVQGGGESISKISNTVNTTVGGVPTFSASVTKRLVRTFQKNDCGNYGVGLNQEVYSPFFTGTATSEISQADADSKANTNATNLCNTWLDDNGQSQANEYGTCSYDYPQMTLSKTMPSSFNLNQSGEVVITMRTLGASTSGEIVMYDDFPSGFEFVNLNSKPNIFNFTHTNNTVTFRTLTVLPAGYFAEFKFVIRAITVGNYSNLAKAYGGNIFNNIAISNTVETFVFSDPIISFSAGVDNYTYNNQTSINWNAAPTDEVFHYNVLTINNQPSTNNSKVKIEFILPIPFRVVDDIQVYYNNDYFTFSQGSAFNIVVFTQKDNVTVPVGQYVFYVFFSLPITYYRMSTVSQDENLRPKDNLVIDALNITVPRKRITQVRNYINNNLISSGDLTIIWSNNYTFLPIFQTTNNRIPNDVNGLTYSFSVNNQNNYSEQYPINFINQQFFATQPIYAINAPRDTTNGVVSINYPYQYVINNFPLPDEYQFGIRIYYRIYKNGLLIKSDINTQNTFFETKIDKSFNEPKYRNTTFAILVDANLNYLYW